VKRVFGAPTHARPRNHGNRRFLGQIGGRGPRAHTSTRLWFLCLSHRLASASLATDRRVATATILSRVGIHRGQHGECVRSKVLDWHGKGRKVPSRVAYVYHGSSLWRRARLGMEDFRQFRNCTMKSGIFSRVLEVRSCNPTFRSYPPFHVASAVSRTLRRPLPRHLAGRSPRGHVYLNDEDRIAWHDILGAACKRFNRTCHAWRQMTNMLESKT
jgi:hypothetical protein